MINHAVAFWSHRDNKDDHWSEGRLSWSVLITCRQDLKAAIDKFGNPNLVHFLTINLADGPSEGPYLIEGRDWTRRERVGKVENGSPPVESCFENILEMIPE